MPRRASFPALRDRADDGIDRHSLAGRRVNRGHNPGDWTRDLGIEFVCGDLEQRIAREACRTIQTLAAHVHDRNPLDLAFISELTAEARHRLDWIEERRAELEARMRYGVSRRVVDLWTEPSCGPRNVRDHLKRISKVGYRFQEIPTDQ